MYVHEYSTKITRNHCTEDNFCKGELEGKALVKILRGEMVGGWGTDCIDPPHWNLVLLKGDWHSDHVSPLPKTVLIYGY